MRRMAALFAVSLLAAGCRGDETSAPEATAIAIDPPSARLTAQGAFTELAATVMAGTNELPQAAVQWSSDSDNVRLTPTGRIVRVEAVTQGSANITARSGAVSAVAKVTVEFPGPPRLLTLEVGGGGTGLVISQPAGIECSTAGTAGCSATFVHGTSVLLTPVSGAGTSFDGWSGGGCTGTGSCTVVMDRARTVGGQFSIAAGTQLLIVQMQGSGRGIVTSVPEGIACSFANGSTDGSCAASFEGGSVVTLTAHPASGHEFAGWLPEQCGSTDSCAVTVDTEKTLTATFVQSADAPVVSVNIEGSDGGVLSEGYSIDCWRSGGTTSGSCSTPAGRGSTVVLRAAPQPGHSFMGWSNGGCTGTAYCIISVLLSVEVTATFAPQAPQCSTGTLPSGTTASAELTAADCTFLGPFFTDMFSMSAPAGGFRVVQSSFAFSPWIYLLRGDRRVLASAFSPADMKVIAPPGSYLLAAQSLEAGMQGLHSVQLLPSDGQAEQCTPVWIVPGIVTTQQLSAGDCLGQTSAGPWHYDRFHVVLQPGQRITVTMRSTSMNSYLEILFGGTRVAFNDNMDPGTSDARVVFTSPGGGTYVIRARTTAGLQAGSYTLTVQ